MSLLILAATVYLTIDTGNMEPAEQIAAILRKHQVKATFFLADEKTKRGDTSLDPAWAPFWRALAADAGACVCSACVLTHFIVQIK